MSRKKKEFPEQVEGKSSFATIYRTPNGGADFFTVSYYLNGQRKRHVFCDYDDAKDSAMDVVQRLDKGEANVLSLSDEDRFIYLRAQEALRPLGAPIDLAVLQFVEATKILNGTPLIEAAKFFVINHGQNSSIKKNVTEVVEELIQSKHAEGRSFYHGPSLI